jgi:hypothetical protein
MTYTTEKNVIEAYLNANFTGVRLAYENDEMTDVSVNEWIRVSIQNADAFQASLGSNPLFRYLGILYFQIFTRPDIGSGRAIEIADMLSALFRAVKVSGITFKTPKLQKLGVRNGWYQVNLSTAFSREDS